MRSKGKMVFIVGACVTIVSVVIIGFLVFRESRALGKNRQTLDVRKEGLRVAQGLDPFPSTPNVVATSNNWVQLRKELGNLSQRMGRNQIIPDKDRTPLQWITLLAKTQKDLRKLAVTNSVVLPEDFAFGFELYDKGTPPAGANVPRLTQQLLMINELCLALYDAGIDEMKRIERTEFEAEAAGRAMRRGRRAGPTQTNVFAEVCPKEQFGIEYLAKESAFIGSLNGLAAHEIFIVVSDVEYMGNVGITEEKEEATRRRPSRVRDRDEEDDEAEEDAGPIVRDTRDRGERIVSGLGHESPATVTLSLDVYTFLLAKERSSR